uniref:Tudor domain-containing protein n=1 Tax=Oryzias sinensis TaxID=183150 RepID=A0A8C7X8P5_9TELE
GRCTDTPAQLLFGKLLFVNLTHLMWRLWEREVTLKGENASQVVQDDQVKGPLRVGSTVEVKTNEGLCGEAVISKLTDASLYTVVFDDGDEKTLRRTSLCLKGERHFLVPSVALWQRHS